MNQFKTNIMLCALLTSLFACNITLTMHEEAVPVEKSNEIEKQKSTEEKQREEIDAKIRDEKLSLSNFHKKIWERTRAAARSVRDSVVTAAKGVHLAIKSSFKSEAQKVEPTVSEQPVSASEFVPVERPEEPSTEARSHKELKYIHDAMIRLKAIESKFDAAKTPEEKAKIVTELNNFEKSQEKSKFPENDKAEELLGEEYLKIRAKVGFEAAPGDKYISPAQEIVEKRQSIAKDLKSIHDATIKLKDIESKFDAATTPQEKAKIVTELNNFEKSQEKSKFPENDKAENLLGEEYLKIRAKVGFEAEPGDTYRSQAKETVEKLQSIAKERQRIDDEMIKLKAIESKFDAARTPQEKAEFAKKLADFESSLISLKIENHLNFKNEDLLVQEYVKINNKVKLAQRNGYFTI